MYPERGQILVGRDVTEEQLSQLARFRSERHGEREFVTHTEFSAWIPQEPVKKSRLFSLLRPDVDKSLNHILASVFTFEKSPGGILVYDPSRQALWSVDEQILEREMGEGGYFHSLAKLNSEYTVLEELSLQGDDHQVTFVESAARFTKFPEPQTHGFSINRTDLHFGNVEFDFRILAP